MSVYSFNPLNGSLEPETVYRPTKEEDERMRLLMFKGVVSAVFKTELFKSMLAELVKQNNSGQDTDRTVAEIREILLGKKQ